MSTTPSPPSGTSDSGPSPAMADGYEAMATDAIAAVERTAQAIYEDKMGSGWPIPYSALKVTEQEEWRGAAYCAAYALAWCPTSQRVHPWLRSWCQPSCRTSPSSSGGASRG